MERDRVYRAQLDLTWLDDGGVDGVGCQREQNRAPGAGPSPYILLGVPSARPQLAPHAAHLSQHSALSTQHPRRPQASHLARAPNRIEQDPYAPTAPLRPSIAISLPRVSPIISSSLAAAPSRVRTCWTPRDPADHDRPRRPARDAPRANQTKHEARPRPVGRGGEGRGSFAARMAFGGFSIRRSGARRTAASWLPCVPCLANFPGDRTSVFGPTVRRSRHDGLTDVARGVLVS